MCFDLHSNNRLDSRWFGQRGTVSASISIFSSSLAELARIIYHFRSNGHLMPLFSIYCEPRRRLFKDVHAFDVTTRDRLKLSSIIALCPIDSRGDPFVRPLQSLRWLEKEGETRAKLTNQFTQMWPLSDRCDLQLHASSLGEPRRLVRSSYLQLPTRIIRLLARREVE